MLQSIIFPKDTFTLSSIYDWLITHNHYNIKPIHTTEHFYRTRISKPEQGSRYYTKELPNGIKFIFYEKP